MNEIFVTGHRNPDTDSIVAAMSYAALRNALGDRQYVAAHLGHVSDETSRMLKHFGFEEPLSLRTVRTQVCDLDFDTPPCLSSSVTMDRAWHVMHEQRISAVPVVNDDGTLYGMLSAGDIATFSMETLVDSHVEELPVFNLVSVLEGRIVNEGSGIPTSISGNVVVAMPQAAENLRFSGSNNIVLCASQPDMIQRALDHVRLAGAEDDVVAAGKAQVLGGLGHGHHHVAADAGGDAAALVDDAPLQHADQIEHRQLLHMGVHQRLHAEGGDVAGGEHAVERAVVIHHGDGGNALLVHHMPRPIHGDGGA